MLDLGERFTPDEIAAFMRAFNGEEPWNERTVAIGHALGVEFTWQEDYEGA